jgi:hypothetical protein
MEGIEHGHRVREAVMNRVGIAAEWVQGGVIDALDEALGLILQPGLVDASGAAHDRIEQPSMQASSLVTGQINHDGDGPINPDPAGPPNMLIHPESLHTGQSVRIAGAGPGLELDRVPRGVPVHAEVPGQRRHRRVIVGQSVGRPPYGAHGEHRTRRGDLMDFAEHPGRTVRLTAAPQSFQPPQDCDPTQARRVVQHPESAAMASRDDSA